MLTYENKADSFDFVTYQAEHYVSPIIYDAISNTMNETTLSAELVENMNKNVLFMASYGLWETATFISNPGEIIEDVLLRETYYESIILRLINMSFESDTAIDWINQKTIKQSVSIGKSLTKYAEQNYYEFLLNNMQNISELNDVQKQCLIDWATEHVKAQKYSIIGEDLSFISTVMSTAQNIEQFSETLAVYLQIANVADSTIEYLKIIKANSENDNLTNALENVILLAEDSFKSLLTNATYDGILALGKTSIKNLIGKQWKNALIKLLSDGVLSNGSVIINGALIGVNLGKTISNMAFSVDAKLDKFESMKCLIVFEEALKKSFETIINNYDGTAESAVLLSEGVDLLYSTLILDAEFFLEMAQISEEDWLFSFSSEDMDFVKSTAKQQIEAYETEYNEISVSYASCGDLLNWIILDDGSLLIYGVGKMESYAEGEAPWYNERQKISELYISSQVTEIGAYAFYDCYNVKNTIVFENTKKVI